MDMLKSKEGLVAEIQVLRGKLKNSRDQNSVLSDQLLLLQKECKNLLNSISTYEESNHKLTSQVARLNEKNLQLKKKLKQSIAACADIKKQAEGYISSIQARFYDQLSRVNNYVNKQHSEEIETSYSFNSLAQNTPFRYDSPAISVSERENDSSIARHDNEDILMAYTQEIKDKQVEISQLNRNLEQKNSDFENFKMNFQTLKENYEKKLHEKDQSIAALQQEVKGLNDTIFEFQSIGKVAVKSGTSEHRKNSNEEYLTQIEALNLKISSQTKKFENYIRTIANLEKQVQLQMVKYSDLESTNKLNLEALQGLENEKRDLIATIERSENRISELETLKVQQAKIINEQSSKINSYKNSEETPAHIAALRRKIETLEDENKKLVESNEFIQNYVENFKSHKEDEIMVLKEEMKKKIEEFEKQIEDKNEKISEISSDISERISDLNHCKSPKVIDPAEYSPWKKIKEYVYAEFKEKNPEIILERLKEMNNSISNLKQLYEDLDENGYTQALTKLKNIIAESKLTRMFFEEFAIPGQNHAEKLENISEILSKSKNTSLFVVDPTIFSISDLKEIISRVLKDYSNTNLSLITKISNAVQKLNLKMGNFFQKIKGKQLNEQLIDKIQLNQIRDYEITTVNECSELEDESIDDDDLEGKVQMSAKRIQDLNKEIVNLKNIIEEKEDLCHNLQMKNANLQKDKEKKVRECSSLQTRVAELENEMKTNKEMFEISDKKKNNMIASLENRISSMKKEYESLKNSILSEKDELFDHIIRIEQESKNQVIW